jgi:Na+/proline symporter
MASRPADSLVPTFMMGYLPSGLRGLLLAAILAAAMPSIDSALNSLAAVTLEDVAGIPPGRQPVWLSRAVSLGWGVFAVVSGIVFARSAGSMLETINLIGSAFYGPVLAVFTLGVLAPRLTGNAPLIGLIVGLVSNLALSRLAPGVSWLWWNPAGFLVTCIVALSISRVAPRLAFVRWPRREAVLLVGAFVVMLAILASASIGVG